MTFETAGNLLEFSDPAKGVSNLVNRRKDEFEENISPLEIRGESGVLRIHKGLDPDGMNLLCMFADTEVAKCGVRNIN